MFVLQALLLAAAPFVSPGFRLAPSDDVRTVAGLALAAYAISIYQVIGWLFGHVYPAVPLFGIAPCPTTIFTIGILLLGPWHVARWLLLIPVLWKSSAAARPFCSTCRRTTACWPHFSRSSPSGRQTGSTRVSGPHGQSELALVAQIQVVAPASH
ncbi:DUF6064 family protein [Sinorhizobium meliloti]|uniref:DUF6064 family protein n=1 Tax=Rhizobium meliloti TaxID=382 RepID=UPI003A7F593C